MEKVKMIVRDVDKPQNIMFLEAATPGHFCWLESAFVECYPEYQGTRFALGVQELTVITEEQDALAAKPGPRGEVIVSVLGTISHEEFVGIFAGTKAPDMTRERAD